MEQQIYLPEYILEPFFGQNPIVGVEIGVLNGHGTYTLLNHLLNLKLYAIDPWIHQEGREFEASQPQEYFDFRYPLVLEKLKVFKDRVIIIKKKSDDAINDVNELVDFVWIDGDHSADQVERDIMNWKTKLKPRSILGGHDWQIEHIQKIIREKLGEPKLGDDMTWWFEFSPEKI